MKKTNMKALVLSGGSGTRLRPLTHTRSKQLVPLANKPILWYGIQAIIDAGIYDIGIIAGDKIEEVKESIGSGKQFIIDGLTSKEVEQTLNFTFIYQDKPAGLAHAVLCAKDFLSGSDFVMYLGDNLLLDGITSVADDFMVSDDAAAIILKEVKDPSMFGVAILDENNNVVRLVEKPKEYISNFALVGVYFFRSTIIQACENITPSERGELEITHAIQYLLDENKVVKANITKSKWLDTGKWQDLVEANKIVLENMFENNKLKSYDNKNIIQPAIVAESAIIENSVIGPNVSIGENCVVKNSRVENSVLMDGSKIVDVPYVNDSVLGNFAVLESSKEPTHKVIVGDHSIVRIHEEN